MKIGALVMAWVFAVIVGSAVCGIVSGGVEIIAVFIIFSALCSLPYLVLMILFTRKVYSFLVQQVIHLALALATAAVIVLFENNFFTFSYILLPYFIAGAGAQAYFYYRNPLKPQRNVDDLLDSE